MASKRKRQNTSPIDGMNEDYDRTNAMIDQEDHAQAQEPETEESADEEEDGDESEAFEVNEEVEDNCPEPTELPTALTPGIFIAANPEEQAEWRSHVLDAFKFHARGAPFRQALNNVTDKAEREHKRSEGQRLSTTCAHDCDCCKARGTALHPDDVRESDIDPLSLQVFPSDSSDASEDGEVGEIDDAGNDGDNKDGEVEENNE